MPEIARRLNLGVSTIYRLLAEQKERSGAPDVAGRPCPCVGIGGGRSWNMYFGPGQYIGDFCDGREVNVLGSVAREYNGRKMQRSLTPKRARRSCRATFVAMM